MIATQFQRLDLLQLAYTQLCSFELLRSVDVNVTEVIFDRIELVAECRDNGDRSIDQNLTLDSILMTILLVCVCELNKP